VKKLVLANKIICEVDSMLGILGQFTAFWKTTSTCVKIAAKLEP